MSGTIEGAESFLMAGYLLTWIVLGGYALSLFIRYRKSRRQG